MPALDGIRVVDLSRVLGGPSATQILGDHGADIIKVEPPQGDETRDWGPPFADDAQTMSAYFMGANRNKRGIALDLGHEKGRAVLLRLLETADILVENFKPGTMERWGIGADDLRARFPRLIHCRVTGFGADGPLGGFPGYDAVVQTMTGLISINGSQDSGPTRIGIPLVDLATGLNSVIAILLALHERQRSGLGQFLDITLYDTGIALLQPYGPNYLMSGNLPRLTGNAHPNVVPYDLYPTATRPIFLGIGNDGQFRKACLHLGRPDVAEDPRFRTNPLRSANRDALTTVMRQMLADKDGPALAEQLLEIGVPAGPANNLREAFEHPHTAHRAMIVEGENGFRAPGPPIKLGRTPAEQRLPPPQFGADNRTVLAQAGFSAAEIDALVTDGVVIEGARRMGKG
ncbi:CaiB/BaiF CoA transferase family protein [Zavarzinia sp. CC-PAN008]|uniref:CaiB/BaiF CoA transferase family protein n=1 Tax=Zavarzinia sp. CC-PAN008 TaxID=3243332 RepID=UPI003F745663